MIFFFFFNFPPTYGDLLFIFEGYLFLFIFLTNASNTLFCITGTINDIKFIILYIPFIHFWFYRLGLG